MGVSLRARASGRLARRIIPAAGLATLLLASLLAVADPAAAIPAPDDLVRPPELPDDVLEGELVEKRTATSRTFRTDNPNRFRTEVYPEPIHYRDSVRDHWRAIDRKLTAEGTPKGRLRAKANAFGLSVAEENTDAALARLEVDDGMSASWRLAGARPGRGAPSGNKIVYRSVLPFVDLHLISLASGMKEDIILRSRKAPDEFLFPLELEGLTAALNKSGSVELVDSSGETRVVMPHGFMEDSNVDPASGEAAYSEGVKYELVGHGDGTALKMTLDRDWLDDPKRVYPVRVDPSAQVSAGIDDTFTASHFVNSNHNGNVELKIGRPYTTETWVWRSFMHFNLNGAGLRDKVIDTARLLIWNNWSYQCSPRYVNVFKITSAWSNILSWSGQPSFNPTPVAQDTFAFGHTGCPTQSWGDWSVKSWVQEWANSTLTNPHGLMLGTNEADVTYWKRFASMNDPRAGVFPHIDITYHNPNSPPATPTNRLPATGARVADTTPTLSAKFSDPDGNSGSMNFQVWNNTQTSVVTSGSDSSVGNNGTASWPVSPALTNGTTYKWRAQAKDSPSGATSAWSAFNSITIDTSGPPAPVISSSTHPDPTKTYASRSFSASWTEPSDGAGVSGYGVVVNQTSSTVPGAQTQTGRTFSTTVSADGTWWLHVRPRDTLGNMGTTAHFKFNVDTSNPAPLVEKFVDTAGPTYTPGQPVRFRIKVTNPQQAVSLSVTKVEDVLGEGLSLYGHRVYDGAAGVNVCNTTTAPACTIAGSMLTIGSFTLPAGGSREFVYDAYGTTDSVTCAALENTATAFGANGTTADAAEIDLCESGLGLESWWERVRFAAGPQAEASVNVGNGNLVLQHLDSTPVQAHGDFAYVLRRTYNSQEQALLKTAPTGALELPSSLGVGWNLNVMEAGELEGIGVTPSALFVPSVTDTKPLTVTLIDRDGTRHAFTPKSVGVIAQAAWAKARGVLTPKALDLTGTISGRPYVQVCVDVSYDAPDGVHLGLWRYIGVNSTASDACSDSALVNSGVVVGFAAERPDRLRYEFDGLGRLVSMIDANGVELRYVYATTSPTPFDLGGLTTVYEPSCSPSGPPAVTSPCRAFHFEYLTSPPRVRVTDPAKRQTTYTFDTNTTKPVLTSVTNPDGSVISYTYSGRGATCTGASEAQLCSVSDLRSASTTFSYTAAEAGGPARVRTVTDRRGTVTTFHYDDPSNGVSVDVVGGESKSQRDRYSDIDERGRVSSIVEGAVDTANTAAVADPQHQITQEWDGNLDAAAQPIQCRQPDPTTVDNNLCERRRAGSDGTPDEITEFVWNAEGSPVIERRLNGATAHTNTFGHRAQYVLSGNDGTAVKRDDTIAGNGTVSSEALPAEPELFVISDRLESLTPRGNAPGAAFDRFRTQLNPDNNLEVAPNVTPSGGTCLAATEANTGNLCSQAAPTADDTQTAKDTTRYSYDTFGQRITMVMPEHLRSNKTFSSTTSACPSVDPGTPNTRYRCYEYVYFADLNTDLSGGVSAGGWMHAVKDPSEKFVAFGHDAAGNTARTWDRNNAPGSLSQYPGTAAAPPNTRYIEERRESSATPFSAPWRYVVSRRDQLGFTTKFLDIDDNGNVGRIRPRRGVADGDSTRFDITQTFDAGDLLATSADPAQRAESKNTSYQYDSFGNRITMTDANGNQTIWRYDTVNREIRKTVRRGGSGTSGCRAATADVVGSDADDKPIPAGVVVCDTVTRYDDVDNVQGTTDGNGVETEFDYDGLHRQTSKFVPRSASSTLETQTVYDEDGNALRVCSPRQFTDSSQGCNATAAFAEHRTYNDAGLVASVTRRRTEGGPALITQTKYDANRNVVATTNPRGHTTTFTYNILDRKVTQTVPRTNGVTNQTTWTYDPSGNLVSVTAPENRITAYGYDNAHQMKNMVVGATSTQEQDAFPAAGDGVNQRTRYFYDPDGNVVAQQNARAFTTVGSVNEKHMVRTDFDDTGRPVASYVPRYDGSALTNEPALGDTTQRTQCPPTTPTTNRPADVVGISEPQYPDGLGLCVTRATYDAVGNRTLLRLPTSNGGDNAFVSFTYTGDNLVACVDSPAPGGTPGTAGCAGASHPAGSADRVATTYSYDGVGQRTAVTDPLGRTTRSFYTRDRLLACTDSPAPQGATDDRCPGSVAAGNRSRTEYGYDANGNRTSVDDAERHDETTAYFADNLVQNVKKGADSATDQLETAYTYDENGNTTTVKSPSAVAQDETNPVGAVTTNRYTHDNLLESSSIPARITGPAVSNWRHTVYEYDGAGRKTAQRVFVTPLADPPANSSLLGSVQRFEYNPDDSPKREVGRTGEAITYKYGPAGNRTEVTDSTGGGSTITVSYYIDDLVRTVTTSGKVTNYHYDGAGSRTARSDDVDGVMKVTRYGYNAAGLPTSMSSDLVTGSWAWTYDVAGRLRQETGPNAHVVDWTPDTGTDDLRQAKLTISGAAKATWDYSYDRLGRQTCQQFAGAAAAGGGTLHTGAQRYAYDAPGRVTKYATGTDCNVALPATPNVTWDHDSNRLTFNNQRFTYHPDDSIKTATDKDGANLKTYMYDENEGRLTNDGITAFGYDGFDRTTSANKVDASSTATYLYDGLDRQRSSTTVAGAQTKTTTLRYDGAESTLIQDVRSATEHSTYVLGPSGMADAMVDKNGATSKTQFLTDDGSGSFTTVTNTDGTMACTARFDPFGEPLNKQTTVSSPCNTGDSTNTLWYRGARRDAATGTYQFGSRTYDPAKAGFTTPDSYRSGPSNENLSVGIDPLTRNTYTYVNGDPVNFVDPTGHYMCVDQCGSEADRASRKHMREWRERKAAEARRAADAFRKFIANLFKNLFGGFFGGNDESESGGRGPGLFGMGAWPEGLSPSEWTPTNLPPTSNTEVQKFLKQMYKPGSDLGNGSTAEALEYEIQNQVRYKSGSGHYIKAKQSVNWAKRLLRELRNSRDIEIVKEVLEPLEQAVKVAEEAAAKAGKNAADMVKGFPKITEPLRPSAPRPTPAPPASPGGGGGAGGILGRFSYPLPPFYPNWCHEDFDFDVQAMCGGEEEFA